MSTSNETIRISAGELNSPAVEDYIAVQQSMNRDMGELSPQPLIIRVIYASWFYLSIASGVGAVVAWMIIEPYYDDGAVAAGGGGISTDMLIFPAVAGFIGLFLGAAEGIMCRNLSRAFLCGIVGLGIGFGGGLIAYFLANIIFTISIMMAIRSGWNPEIGMPTGLAFFLLMTGRAAAWAVAGLPAGMGQGIALREKKVVLNGILGGVLGGLVGGMMFDPLTVMFEADDAAISRGVGFTCIGLFVGLFVGLVEGWTKTAWLLMRKGPLAGKQFVMYRDTTVLGSSPKADIYLFKDDAIEPRHAIVHNRGGRFEIEDCNTPDGTYVNGIPIKRQILQAGDQVVLGKTVLEFSVKESS